MQVAQPGAVAGRGMYCGEGLNSFHCWTLGMRAGKYGAGVKERTLLLPSVQESFGCAGFKIALNGAEDRPCYFILCRCLYLHCFISQTLLGKCL